MNAAPTLYFDYNATTPVDANVLTEMMPFFSVHFGNAASKTHFAGRLAADAVEKSRKQVADLIGAEPSEIIFTSGSTEAINLAIKGVAEIYKSKGRHIITWETEHKAVLDTYKRLESQGFTTTLLPVDRNGLPDLQLLEKAITKETILVSMMMANNETGVVMPVAATAQIVHSHACIFLSDATQSPGKMRIDVNESGIDLLSLSAHKMYGPKGTGILYVRRKNPRVKLAPLIDGGGHENGLRSGTLNVPGIVGMGKASELCASNYWDDTSAVSKLRTILEQSLTDNGMGYVNGDMKNRLPNTTNICFPGLRATELIAAIPRLAIATGSACTSAIPEPSHVLKAMGLSPDEAYSSVRFSLGRFTTPLEIDETIHLIQSAVKKLMNKE